MNSTIPPDSVNAILCISFGPLFCRAPVLLVPFIIPLGTQHLVCSSHTVVYTPDQGLSCRLTMQGLSCRLTMQCCFIKLFL